MAGQFYARWVPPKPATKAKQSSPVTESQRAAGSPERTKQKKHRKTELNHTPSRGDGRAASNSAEPSSEQTIPSESISESPSTSKKPKKRKRELQADDRTEREQDATPKKHKTILSKFERSSKLVKAAKNATDVDRGDDKEEDQPPEQLHDLVPLPQPAPVPDTPFEPTFSTLPTWLAKPVTVESSKTVPFSELGVHQSFQKKLAKQGFKDALAVQSVLLPMLHPGYDQHLGDICVSARTGSGKTLAYLLPIIEALKDQAITTLSAIVVVPTRQLVDQALQVAEELCAGTKLKVGTALGNVPFATEQKQLVKMRVQYDPARAKELYTMDSHYSTLGRGGIFSDLPNVPKDHVPQYESGVDILICTPGRLVEHIESTTGFLLRSVRWLVIDEADQLLTQNFQGWASTLIDALHSDTPDEFMNSQEQLRRKRQASKWSLALPARRQITKVVLSATMKKDLTKLGTLRLRRPKLVVVEDETEEQPAVIDGDVFELPTTLTECALPVGDGSNKPLYLLFLLLRHILTPEASNSAISGTDSSSESDSESDSSSDSDSDSTSSDSNSEAQPKQKGTPTIAKHLNRVLIFAKSNENASRLSHLISVLEPSLSSSIKTMTPSATAKQSQKLLKSFGAGKIRILIASDAASRGLDIPDITHVINYDIPSSITSYVHRVGRTARAGKDGQAWTLVTKTEAGWFWNQIAKGGNVKRGTKKVTRVEFKERDVTWDRKRTYQEALQALQGAVEGVDEAAG